MWKLLVSVLLIALCSPEHISGDKQIGSLYQCAHDLRGLVIVKNEREVVIQGLNYDGKGPAAWFHAQKRGAKGVYTSDDDYVTLPFPDASCDRLKPGRSYKDENVTLVLPESIKNYETIGILCYQFCHNFGHIVIPKDLDVPAAPESLLKTTGCPPPNYSKCTLDGTRNGALKPDCTAGSSSQMMPTSPLAGGGAGRLYICVWLVAAMYFGFLKISPM